MRILFDHGTPRGLAGLLVGHNVVTAYRQGWDRLSNGALLEAAEVAAFDVLLTTDQRIRFQQKLTGRRIAIVVLTGSTKWSRIRLHVERISDAIGGIRAGGYVEVEIPFA